MTYALILLVHVVLGAVWLGAMVYSLVVVQPKMSRYFGGDEERHEAFAATLASGNRRPVLAVIATLLLTGLILLGHDGLEAVHLVKLGLLLGASGVFAWVSWRHWPRRVFAVPGELARLRRRLRVAAWSMVVLVGTAFAVSVLVG